MAVKMPLELLRNFMITLGTCFLGSAVALFLIVADSTAQAPLGTASTFAVLAGSTVTNTGATVVTGNVGVSPGTAVTGFPPGTMAFGTIDAGNPVASQAHADLATAYSDLVGLTCPNPNNLTGQDLGPLTLTPGVYCFNSSAQLTGNLTLDGENNPNATFTFQIGTTLTTASNSQVVLINGAQPGNVLWQVGSSATIGSGTVFQGNILAFTSITFTTSATSTGRALAQNGAVTLDTNTISIPGLITVVKNTVGGDDTFNFTDNFGLTSLTTVDNTASQTVNSLTPGGSYNVSETVPSGWTQTSATCTNGTPAAVTVVGGATTTCTFTNTLAPAPTGSITVVKNTVEGNGTFTFTDNFGLTSLTTVGNTASQTVNSLTPGGSYNVSETVPSGWTQTSATCTNGTPAAVTVVGGATTTCTFTNTVVTPPGVSSTVPAKVATNVPVGNALSATFSEAMNPATINTSTFTLQNGLTPVAGTVDYIGVTATFTPLSTLAPNTVFTTTITTGVQDRTGDAMVSNYVWSFTTGATPDTTPPTVSSTVPATGAINVPISNALSATFSEAMNPLTITTSTFTLQNGLTPVAGTVTYAGVTAAFTPTSTLAPNTVFTTTITTGVTDLAGNALVINYVWTFTTGSTPDTTTPTVSSTVPTTGAINVPISNALSTMFSGAMNPLTITTSTFTLQNGLTPVAGTVTYAGVTAAFTPTSTLAPNTVFTTTITTGVTDLAGNALVTNYVWTFTTGAAPDTTPPTVSSTVPATGSINVPIGNALSATFSEALNPLAINTSTFSLMQGTSAVPGTVTYAGVTAAFTPTSTLAPNTVFTTTITTGVTDLAGNAMVSNYVWSFTTGATPATTPPTVSSTVPATGAINVPISNALSATFSEAMNPLTITTSTITLQNGLTPVAGTVTYDGVTAIFTPVGALAPNTLFTATISTGVNDLAGNALVSNYGWSFTTGATANTTPPNVISTFPDNVATLVTPSINVIANFSELMNPLTISTASFILQQGATPVPGTVTYGGTFATFRPASNLAANTQYKALITSAVASLAGTALAANYQWSFTTGSAADQPPVCPSNFAVLSGSPIVNSGTTIVTGDIGVSPETFVTGFPLGTLTGTIYSGDSAAAQRIADLSAAYQDAVLRSVGPVAVAGDLAGQTFPAGLYKSISSLSVSSGTLALDAKGDPNAVFIFQMPSTLTTAAGSQIILVGNASAFNVFWQVGASATLGANSVFNGSILANQSITLNAGSIVNGRLLAQSGAVTLQSNTITSPPPSIAVGGIFNAASDGQTVAAGSIASVFGNNLGSSLVSSTGYPLPTVLGGSRFQVGAQEAPLFMTSCRQANLQIPWEVLGQTQVPVTATEGGLVSTQEYVTVAQFAPGIFSLNQAGSGQGAVEIAPTSQLAAPLGPAGHPVKRGEYIAIFCTGLGPVSNRPATGAAALSSPLSSTLTLPTVTLGAAAAKVTYSGLAPGFAGLYQVNAIVPDGAPSGDNVGLVITMGGVQSNTVTIAIQ
jgi:uncharacterized protein (TIGR03437 family)